MLTSEASKGTMVGLQASVATSESPDALASAEVVNKSDIELDVDVSKCESVKQGATPDMRSFPMWAKVAALVCTLLLQIGSKYSSQAISALKTPVTTNMGITNTQYSITQSAVSFINSWLPIVMGFFIDALGTAAGSISATVVIFIGQFFVALSTNLNSYGLLVTGRTIFGLGSGCIVVVQESILSHWFGSKSIGLAIGLQLSFARLWSFVAQVTVNPLAESSGFYGAGFWLATGFCALSVIANVAYILLLRHFSRTLMSEDERSVWKKKKGFNWKQILHLPLAFWAIVFNEILLGGLWTSFGRVDTQMIEIKWDEDTITAANFQSISLLFPILISPVLGATIDRVGLHVTIAFTAACLFVAGNAMLAYTWVNPMGSMSVYALSSTIGPVGINSCIPLILPVAAVGTGFGIFKSAMSAGATIWDVLSGILQDNDPEQDYDGVYKLFIGLGIVTICGYVILYAIDFFKYHRVLEVGAKKRKAVMHQLQEEGKMGENKRKRWNYAYIVIFFCILVLSWGLFFSFLV